MPLIQCILRSICILLQCRGTASKGLQWNLQYNLVLTLCTVSFAYVERCDYVKLLCRLMNVIVAANKPNQDQFANLMPSMFPKLVEILSWDLEEPHKLMLGTAHLTYQTYWLYNYLF
jgi:hypothetical protein